MHNVYYLVSMNFWATVCKTVRLITVGPIKMKLGLQVGLDPGHIVLDGDPAPLHSPQFSAHVSCGQMAA